MTERFDIEIDIAGPVSTAGLVTTAYGIDTSFLRNHESRIVIPRTLAKGVVRHILEAMSSKAPSLLPLALVREWLGTRSDDARENGSGHFEPGRELVRFTDFAFLNQTSIQTLTRIKIDDGTGSVERGMLQVIESPLAIGETGTFRGSVSIDLESKQANEAMNWVLKALRLAPALGGAKGAGFGRVMDVRLCLFSPPALSDPEERERKQIKIATDQVAIAATDIVRYILMFDEPFLVGSEAISGNLFRGSTIIPGAAVKGALADQLGRDNELAVLAEALDKVIFRHAKPSENGKPAPRMVPLSLYSVEEINNAGAVAFTGLVDALATPVNDDSMLGKIITFQGDWKSDSRAYEAAKKCARQTFEPLYDVRTRTAVGKDDVAESGMLFTRLAVCPDGKHVWVGELLRGKASSADFAAIVAALGDGLYGLGKTRASPRVAILSAKSRAATPLKSENGRSVWRVVLETDALLHGPGDIEKHAACIDRSERLRLQYRDYFAQTLGDGEGLVDLRFFAQQRWVGGYQAKRFPHFPDRYAPQLLTLAGSVFEIAAPQELDGAVKELAVTGLPLPRSVPQKQFQYQRSPFNRENGYGEVSIEDRDLTKAAPEDA